MNNSTKLEIYKAQVKNSQALIASGKHLRKSINAALKKNDNATVETLTKLYALLFTSFAEASFSKIIHTPYGFDSHQIKKIMYSGWRLNNIKKWSKRSITDSWITCLDLGLKNLDAKKGNFQPNARLKLRGLIEENILDPSVLRNKLAHGQWVKALNRANDAIQEDHTARIANLNIVTIGGWMRVHSLLANVMEDLIESPNKTFTRDWYIFVHNLEREIKQINSRTFEEHIERLKAKEARSSMRVVVQRK